LYGVQRVPVSARSTETTDGIVPGQRLIWKRRSVRFGSNSPALRGSSLPQERSTFSA